MQTDGCRVKFIASGTVSWNEFETVFSVIWLSYICKLYDPEIPLLGTYPLGAYVYQD